MGLPSRPMEMTKGIKGFARKILEKWTFRLWLSTHVLKPIFCNLWLGEGKRWCRGPGVGRGQGGCGWGWVDTLHSTVPTEIRPLMSGYPRSKHTFHNTACIPCKEVTAYPAATPPSSTPARKGWLSAIPGCWQSRAPRVGIRRERVGNKEG